MSSEAQEQLEAMKVEILERIHKAMEDGKPATYDNVHNAAIDSVLKIVERTGLPSTVKVQGGKIVVRLPRIIANVNADIIMEEPPDVED